MKILIMVSTLTSGGAERVAVSWANGLSKLGHEVELLTDLNFPITYQPNEEVKLIPSKNIVLKSKSLLNKVINKIRVLVESTQQLITILRKSRPDVIVNILYYNVYQLQMARLISYSKIPIIMTDHNAYERPKGVKMSKRQWINKFIDNRFFNLVTVLTKRDKELLAKKRIKNVKVLHNPLFTPPCETLPDKQKIVLAIGRLDAWYSKGFDILLEAWKSVHRQHPDWKLHIKGSYVESVINMLKHRAEEATDSIEFVPYDEHVIEEYDQASIFVLSSRYEGWGLVAVEAMSRGCATIACNYEGRQAEYINDHINGLLCEPNNPDSLSEKIIYLIENQDLRHQLQSEAIKSVQQFSEDKVAIELQSIIKDLV